MPTWLDQSTFGKVLNLFWHCSTKQECLTLGLKQTKTNCCRKTYELQLSPQKQSALKMTGNCHHLEVGKNCSDIFLKSHVNHAISFIQNQIPRRSANKPHYYMATRVRFDWLVTPMGITKICLCPAILISARNKTQ